MILYTDKNQCCGCGVCSEVCGHNAIEMKLDEEGFLYPVIDNKNCVNCGLCKSYCAFQNVNTNSFMYPIQSYAAKHSNEVIREKSQSGGLFSALSDYALGQDGSVYGVVINQEFCAVHTQAQNEVERDRQRGSKYIQSILHPVLKQFKDDAKSGKKIVFTGTACQIDAVKSYLKGSCQENIYYVDILCHGVPSPMVWKDYLKWCQHGKSEQISRVVFRDKTVAGWHRHVELIEFENHKIESGIFRNLFYEHCILRPSCYSCPYARIERTSDITIGDCWGIEKNNPELDDNRGVSLALVNTHKGEEMLQYVENSLELHVIELEQYMQRPLRGAAEIPLNREKFWKDYLTRDFSYIVKKYASDDARKRNRQLEKYRKIFYKLFKR